MDLSSADRLPGYQRDKMERQSIHLISHEISSTALISRRVSESVVVFFCLNKPHKMFEVTFWNCLNFQDYQPHEVKTTSVSEVR